MSQVDDAIATANALHKEDIKNAAIEHMQWLDAQRVASEIAMQNSVKGNWERLIAKRKTQQVLRRLPLPQLQ